MCQNHEDNTSLEVKVDVTKIVKYVCIAGILIIGIIFGTKCMTNLSKQDITEA